MARVSPLVRSAAASWHRSRPRDTVRACYLVERPPYAFVNRNRELVGLDIEMAHQLANDLQVRLQLVPTSAIDFATALEQGRCDIGTGGIVATPGRAAVAAFSMPYMHESLAFVMPDHLRNEYDTWDKIRARRNVRIGFPDLPYFRRQLEQRLPEATLVPVPAMNEVFTDKGWAFEALVLSAERGAFLSLLHPGYSVVVPSSRRHHRPRGVRAATA